VRDYFDEFEQIYPEQFRKQYVYWRPVIRDSIDKFLNCGDLKEGFTRVRCPDCGTEFFAAFSFRQRCCCPSSDQKRSLLWDHRLIDQIFSDVPHCQWEFSMPKRLRILFRYNRQLLGAFCRLAYESNCEVMQQASSDNAAVAGMVGATLEKLDVQVNQEKSRVVDLTRDETFRFLGFDIRRVKTLRGKGG
jgi:hypothetical protein